jgi:hypothetical protein
MPLPKFDDEAYEFPDEKEEKAKSKAESKKEDDFQLEIEDDTPPEDRGRKPAATPPEDPTDDELASYDEKVQARIKKFTRGYHDERRAKETAERERQAAEDFARQVFEENKRLQQQLSTGSKAYIETSKGAAQGELDAAKKRYRDAYEAGNADELVAAQEEIAKATLKIDKAEGLRPIEIEDREFKPATQPAEPKVSPKTKRWLENNSDWFGSDDEMTMAAMGLDKRLQREYGADYIGTDDYFKRIDSTMRKRFPEYFDTQSQEEDDEPPPRRRAEPVEEDEPPRRAQKPSASPVAPASRSTPPNRIKLKTSQVALARKLGITPEQYAKQVALLTRGE